MPSIRMIEMFLVEFFWPTGGKAEAAGKSTSAKMHFGERALFRWRDYKGDNRMSR
jgi:hypothetical protein